MVRGVGRSFRGVVDLGVKKGPFYVLFLSSMPAVLVEAGFLTNRKEAKRLRDEAPLYRNDKYDFWALSRFDDVLAASLDDATFSSAHGTVLELITEEATMFITTPARIMVTGLITPLVFDNR